MKKILFTVSGKDTPGITFKLTEVLVEEKAQILDMGQAVTHGLLSLSFLISTNNEQSIIKELLFVTNQLGMKLDYQDFLNANPSYHENQEKFVLSCVSSRSFNPLFIRDIAKTLTKHNANILRIDNISPKKFECLEFNITLKESQDKIIRSSLLQISDEHKIDIAVLKDNVYRRSKRLIAFDMDSTLIQTEVIDRMAEVMGIEKEVAQITERAMNGEIDFTQSLLERVSKLKGLKVDDLQNILENLSYAIGVEEFIKTVKSLGYKLAILSGGFTFFSDALKNQLNIDYAFANQLEIIDNKLTGKITGTIIDPAQKALLLKTIAQQENFSLEQTVAIGDGSNDLEMLSTAGLGIAYHAKTIVRQQAQQHLSHGPMTSILYFLGISNFN